MKSIASVLLAMLTLLEVSAAVELIAPADNSTVSLARYDWREQVRTRSHIPVITGVNDPVAYIFDGKILRHRTVRFRGFDWFLFLFGFTVKSPTGMTFFCRTREIVMEFIVEIVVAVYRFFTVYL